MARIFITGSVDGLGLAAARALQAGGHQLVVHGRSRERLEAARELLARGARAVVGDLADLTQTRELAEQLNALGQMDAVIHNAGVFTGAAILPVNVAAPYALTALITRPRRLIYLSSEMHYDGRPELGGLAWDGARETASYSDSKLFVTALAAAVARRWPDVISQAVDPGWVPTKMGGPDAPGDLRLGHVTQAWLATTDDAAARASGGYWHHQERREPHPAVHDEAFQARLLDALSRATGIDLA
ncbi:SDR family NAD(P)-dependent oxidoreductase [Achromobacter xylosoxidans]|uniref:SDR family NAD(P)-dependent oxidoreductase n=1 Tax=Alcaligenes xylosoxydans xylosoxydans TaxID=85698 RepID=UPI001564A9C0|nr:SDR family NAD(P)-dependent oxidoreductase [Achromobacter xylosoxidans]QKI68454.1 SDR family NAD(P)-dependent oxidoreductase [Achromobacter xylosoxidans]